MSFIGAHTFFESSVRRRKPMMMMEVLPPNSILNWVGLPSNALGRRAAGPGTRIQFARVRCCWPVVLLTHLKRGVEQGRRDVDAKPIRFAQIRRIRGSSEARSAKQAVLVYVSLTMWQHWLRYGGNILDLEAIFKSSQAPSLAHIRALQPLSRGGSPARHYRRTHARRTPWRT